MPKKLTITLTARGYELDSYNHINNAVYLNYFEHARWEYFRQTDLYGFLKEMDNLPVVTDIHIRYQREVRLFDELLIESFCVQEKPYLVFQQKIMNLTTGLAAARATTKLVFVDEERVIQDDHQIFFAGSVPHNLDGKPIPNLGGGPTQLVLSDASKDIVVQRSFSNKPRDTGTPSCPIAIPP